jgi:hypothetical protein
MTLLPTIQTPVQIIAGSNGRHWLVAALASRTVHLADTNAIVARRQSQMSGDMSE